LSFASKGFGTPSQKAGINPQCFDVAKIADGNRSSVHSACDTLAGFGFEVAHIG
jgi:hypothetical protein